MLFLFNTSILNLVLKLLSLEASFLLLASFKGDQIGMN